MSITGSTDLFYMAVVHAMYLDVGTADCLKVQGLMSAL